MQIVYMYISVYSICKLYCQRR